LREGAIDLAISSALNWASQIKALNCSRCRSFQSKALDAVLTGESGAALLRTVTDAGSLRSRGETTAFARSRRRIARSAIPPI
jgi:hypothetical protein